MVTDDSGVIGLGGVMGGEATEISETTTRVLVEAAHWDATSMFRTGRRHKITSEAGKRNERGVDPAVTEAAADRVVELLVAHGGAHRRARRHRRRRAPGGRPRSRWPPTCPPASPVCPSTPPPRSAHLRAVGCEVEERGDVLVAVPPPWRPDLTDPHDLVEEVARVVGYDQVPSVLPTPPAGRGLTRGPAAAASRRTHARRCRLRRGGRLPVPR